MSTLQDRVLAGYLTEDVVARLLRPKPKPPFAKRTLQLWRAQGVGPPYVQFGKTILYPESGLYAWLESRTHQPVRERTRKSA
jgi:hypothetical protein